MIRFAEVELGELRPNTWNPNEMDAVGYEKTRRSIRRFGFIDPITVRQAGDGFEIIDGEHRWRAARDEGLETVPVVIVEADTDEAEQLTILLNELRGRPNPSKLAAVIQDLASRRSVNELEAVLPIRRQQLAEMVAGRRESIDWQSLSERKQALSPSTERERWVERVFRLPASAAEVVDQALDRVRRDETMEDWQALEAICADYLAGA